MPNLSDNLAKLEGSITSACRAANRQREEIQLIAVSKNHPTTSLIEAANLGLTHFGENRVQEFAAKQSELPPEIRNKIKVHLIGHLQSNKSAKAIEIFDSIDTLDSLKLAERLNESTKRIPVLLEIKLSHEESKAGLTPNSQELEDLLTRLPDLTNLNPEGLMTIAPLGVPESETRICFRNLRILRDQIATKHPRLNLPVLSMGMSGDFAIAIAEGATRIRVGTALFGNRE